MARYDATTAKAVTKTLPWPAEGMRVCLIGYHGALHQIAVALRDNGIQIGTVVSHIDDSDGKEGPEAFLSAHGLFPSMAEISEAAGAPLMHLPDPNTPQAIETILATGANVVISASAPILKENFIEAFEGWTFNIHGSHRYRGRGGLSWCLLNGITDDTVVLHWLNRGIDTGDMILEEPFSWSGADYPIDLFKAQYSALQPLVRRWLDMVHTGEISSSPQNAARPYLPALITDEDGWIDWRWAPDEIERAVRAFGWPYGGASSLLEDSGRGYKTHIRIARCHVLDDHSAQGFHPLTNGSVLAHEPNGGVDVACGGGILHIETLRKNDGEFFAGDHIRVGMRMRNRA